MSKTMYNSQQNHFVINKIQLPQTFKGYMCTCVCEYMRVISGLKDGWRGWGYVIGMSQIMFKSKPH
jgi:hypothetical protein